MYSLLSGLLTSVHADVCKFVSRERKLCSPIFEKMVSCTDLSPKSFGKKVVLHSFKGSGVQVTRFWLDGKSKVVHYDAFFYFLLNTNFFLIPNFYDPRRCMFYDLDTQ